MDTNDLGTRIGSDARKNSEEQKAINVLKSSKLFGLVNTGQGKIGITRKDKKQPKNKRDITKKSNKINRLKKRHHWTTKEKKAR